MATAEQLKALIESVVKHDDRRFRAVTMQIAALAAKQGKQKLAKELRELLDRAPEQREMHVGDTKAIPIARPSRELAGLLVASYPETHLSDMVLPEALREELDRVVMEYRQRERLRAHGLVPKRRLLLVGPAGCGKTMTATALAGECHLPLLSVQLHALITKFMGETASKLHVVFETIEKTPGVYLFDEFDAIGSVRGSTNDVGEIRRVLNSLLVFLERHQSDSLVIAASNLLPILDSALFRRFDAVLHYELPASDAVRQLIENRLSAFETARLSWKKLAGAAAGLSHAEIVAAAEDAAKLAVLGSRKRIHMDDLLRSLQAKKRLRPGPEDG